ncbi:MAG: DoxX family protein [Chitinophagaceae bacterium]|jgi:putative oxidoreductase|nr:DoxX family protein [Chitinophagaceae bacterium]
MKKLLSIRYSAGAFNFSMLVLRLAFGILMIAQHGMPKLMDFEKKAADFYDPIGIGSQASLIIVLFAEIFCSFFIVLGLFTRLAVIPLIILVTVAFFGRHGGAIAHGEMALLYLAAYIVLLFCGPGRASVDGMIKK